MSDKRANARINLVLVGLSVLFALGVIARDWPNPHPIVPPLTLFMAVAWVGLVIAYRQDARRQKEFEEMLRRMNEP